MGPKRRQLSSVPTVSLVKNKKNAKSIVYPVTHVSPNQYHLSDSSEQSFYTCRSVNDNPSDTISEWVSYSIVGVFLLFFFIIAAFYIYNRMRFNISEDLGPVSVPNIGVNLNELFNLLGAITVDKTSSISLSLGCKLRSFLWRTGKYSALVFVLISIVLSIIKYISHKKKIQNEDQAAIQDLVKKSIELLQSPDEPRSMPVIHIRDTLLTPQQRKDSRWKRIWSKVVEIIENNDYRINSAIEEIDGEEFKTWKWCGGLTTKDRLNDFRMDATTMRTGTIEWQGSAFDSTSDTPGRGLINQANNSSNGSINSVPVALTEFLKLRNIPNKNDSSSWKTQLRNAIIEKCTAYSPNKYHGILHIDFGSADKEELFIYLKCDSIESATNNFAALHGWWCERSLVSVKFLKSDRYYEKFPEAISASTPLKILNIDL